MDRTALIRALRALPHYKFTPDSSGCRPPPECHGPYHPQTDRTLILLYCLLTSGGIEPHMTCRNRTIERTKDNAMLLAFLHAYWWAPVISLGALCVQCTQPSPVVALILHAL